MPDQFDIQRGLDNAAADLVDVQMEKLDEAKEKARQHPARRLFSALQNAAEKIRAGAKS